MGNRLVDVAVVVIMEAQNAQNTFDGVIERGHTVTFGVPGKIRIQYVHYASTCYCIHI